MKLWNTGVDDNGTQLGGGARDPHWKLLTGPHGTEQDVYVLDNQNEGSYFGPTSDSRWVWADRSGKAETSTSKHPKPYIFQQKFQVDVDPTQYSIRIHGKWGADNSGKFTIDGQDLPMGSWTGDISFPLGGEVDNYTKEHSFALSLSRSFLPLNVGEHTLEVWVYNWEVNLPESQNPAGFNLSTLRVDVRPSTKLDRSWVAIDPLSIILPTDIYLNWLEINKPREPLVAQIQGLLRSITPEERKAILIKATQMVDYGRAFKEAAGRKD